jgi:DNA-binding CsgD family transcriptional regulator
MTEHKHPREDGPEALGLDDSLLAIAMREAYAATIGGVFVPWTPDNASVWPHADRIIRDRFHSDWTNRLYAASGVNPDHVVGTHHVETPQRTTAEIVKRYEQGAGPKEIAATFGLGERQVFRLIRKAGVGPRIVPNRERVKAMHAEGKTDNEMAVTLRITRARVTQLRQSLGLASNAPPVTESLTEVRRANARAARAIHLAAEAEARAKRDRTIRYLADVKGHRYEDIAAQFKLTRIRVAQILAAQRRAA